MNLKNLRLKTALFNSGTSALFASMKSLGLKFNSLIAIPDYYCEEVILSLSRNYRLVFYEIDENFLPVLDSLKTTLNLEIDAVILVQHFNFLRNLQIYIDLIKKCETFVIIDAIHLFLKFPENFYKKADAVVFSLKKPCFLSEGALVFINNQLLKTNFSIFSLSPKRNLISLLKLLRFLVSIFNILNISSLFKKKATSNSKKINCIQSADLISILIYEIFKETQIISFLNYNMIFKVKNDENRKLTENILSFAFDEKVIQKKENLKYFLWPLAINNKRSFYWTQNANNIYKSTLLYSPYLKF